MLSVCQRQTVDKAAPPSKAHIAIRDSSSLGKSCMRITVAMFCVVFLYATAQSGAKTNILLFPYKGILVSNAFIAFVF